MRYNKAGVNGGAADFPRISAIFLGSFRPNLDPAEMICALAGLDQLDSFGGWCCIGVD